MKEKSIILCAGMLRSGSTLQFNVVCRLLQEAGVEYVTSFATLTEYLKERPVEGEKLVVLKSHRVDFSSTLSGNIDLYVTYTYRDLRDVYLSGKEKFGWRGDVLEEKLDGAIENYNSVKDTSGVPKIMQDYEGMYRDLRSRVVEMVSFLGLSKISDAQVDRVVDSLSVDSVSSYIESKANLRRNKKFRKFADSCPTFVKKLARKNSVWSRIIRSFRGDLVDEGTMFHANHISQRKGEPGLWKEYLNQEEIDEIERRYSTFMTERGYI